VLGGERSGTFFPPTVLAEIPEGASARHEEFFGPVAAVYKVGSEDEAVKVANDTPFGLGSYVFTTDADQARAVGRKALEIYLNLANYTNNWKRLGFTEADIAKPGSDALVDAFVAYGTVDAIAARLKEHLAAGADHVPVQVLTGNDKLVPALAELAGPLGP